MDNRTFYKIHRKDSPEKKLHLLVTSVEQMVSAEHKGADALFKNRELSDYYHREWQGMRERARWLYSDLWDMLAKGGSDGDQNVSGL